MENQGYDYGMIGLGTMGRNLVYNMCDHGYSVAGYDKDISMVEQLEQGKGNYKIVGARSLKELTDALKRPRVLLMLVPAGPIVDGVIEALKPLLSEDDLIIDCGNSHFSDTNLRIDKLSKANIHFMGIGISGARNGPSIMPGGSKAVYERVAHTLDAISAKANGEPFVQLTFCSMQVMPKTFQFFLMYLQTSQAITSLNPEYSGSEARPKVCCEVSEKSGLLYVLKPDH